MLFFGSHHPCQHQPYLGVTASDESGEQGVRRSLLAEGQLGMRFIWGWEGEGKAGNYRVLRTSYHFFPMATACMEVHKYVCACRNSRLISRVEIGFGHLLVEVLSVHVADSLFSLTSTPKQSAGVLGQGLYL